MPDSLKKIPLSDLRLGMYLKGLEGVRLLDVLGREGFLLRDAQDLAALQASGAQAAWIDTRLGLGVRRTNFPRPAAPTAEATPVRPPAPAHPVVARAPAAPPALEDAVRPPAGPTPRVELAVEIEQASAVCRRARVVVKELMEEARLGRSLDTEHCLPLVDEITQSVARNPGALIPLTRLRTADEYTYMHSVSVCALMVGLARQLGLSEHDCFEAGLAGLLHDIGKAAIPLEVLNKPGRLTDEEFDLVRTHPLRGFEILEGSPRAIERVNDVSLHHHERFDGTGYPNRLPGGQISLFARMGAVCDVYDAVTTDRPYKTRWDPGEAIFQMNSWQGHFDPEIFQAFVRVVGVYPTGSIVRLESDMVAVVFDQNAHAIAKPVVQVFYSLLSRTPLALMRLDLSDPACRDRIVGREPAERWKAFKLDQIWREQARRLSASA